jgi:hypothetical protein
MNLLDLAAQHLVDHDRADNIGEAIEMIATQSPGEMINLLAKIKVEALPFSSGVRTFELSDD